ncbi:hypothetical protein C8Q72DRAFT_823161, partial [Fomitopsis betulina]
MPGMSLGTYSASHATDAAARILLLTVTAVSTCNTTFDVSWYPHACPCPVATTSCPLHPCHVASLMPTLPLLLSTHHLPCIAVAVLRLIFHCCCP